MALIELPARSKITYLRTLAKHELTIKYVTRKRNATIIVDLERLKMSVYGEAPRRLVEELRDILRTPLF